MPFGSTPVFFYIVIFLIKSNLKCQSTDVIYSESCFTRIQNKSHIIVLLLTINILHISIELICLYGIININKYYKLIKIFSSHNHTLLHFFCVIATQFGEAVDFQLSSQLECCL